MTVTDENGNKHEISALADEMLTQIYLRAKKAERGYDEARRQAATYAGHIEELTAERDNLERDLEHFKRDWLALLREIAKLYDAVQDLDESEAWQHAGDATVWQEFDPWEALTVATATVKAGRDGAGPIANKTAPRIYKLEADRDLWRERALVARRKYHETRHERDEAVDALSNISQRFVRHHDYCRLMTGAGNIRCDCGAHQALKRVERIVSKWMDDHE